MAGEPRVDVLSGRKVVVAAARARRPGAGVPHIEGATVEELDACPFCEGREDRTPPETLALGRDANGADTPGWHVRVVPNLYPAFERQEVVVHSPRHVRSFADLTDGEVSLVATAWRSRGRAARGAGFGYVHALINEGRLAGASLPHSHSQLVWMREPPPAVRAEGDAGERILELLGQIRGDRAPGLAVEWLGDVIAFCPPAGRAPYEVLVANQHTRDAGGLDSEHLEDMLLVLRNVVRRLRAVEGPVPWNAWLHLGSDVHLELVPRLTVLAGVELGAGIYINSLPPEDAAAALRGASGC